MYRFGKFLTKNKCLAVVCLLLLLVSWNDHRGTGVWAGCRQQLDKCGPICVFNEETRQFDCNLRSVLILPNTTSVEASLNKMTIVWRLAWQKIEQMQLLPSNLNVTWKAYDDRCDASYALISAMDGHFKDCADVIFGPICDYALASVSRIAKYFKSEGTPVITTGGNSHDFSVPKNTCDDEYYMLVRTGMISYKTIAEFTIEIMQKYNWTKLAYLYEKNGQYEVAGLHTCHLLMNALAKYHRENNITISSFSAVKFQNMTEILMREVGNHRSVVILCANSSTIREMMLSAEELQMVSSGEYVFFNIELYSSTSSRPWYKESDTDERNERAKKAFSALLTVIAKPPDNDEYMTFSDEVKALAAEEHSFEFNQDEPVSIFVAAFYDAIMLYAHALRDYIEELPDALHHPLNGTRMVQLMWNRTFKGITGNVTINENGDRVSDYSLLDMNPETDLFEVVANYIQGRGVQYVEGKKIHWAGGREGPPSDHPVCGFDGSLCPDNSLHGYAILSLILGFVVIALCIISFLGYRHYRLEVEINSMTWKVNWNDVLPCNPSSNHRGSIHSMGRRGSQATFNSEDIGSLPGDRQLYIPIGFYKGNKVAIKKINPNNIVLDRNLMLELKRMKDIQHDHLVRFYGACVDPPDCYILTEYCPKGSLQDILENEQIKLDWMFKLSLMHDIIRGLHYLHTTEIGSHGSLKSSNCVVDSRFVLKITDFGLYELRKPDEDDECENVNSYAYWKRKLWTAPELLRLPKPPKKGTQKGDVYSLGIIVHEIVTRQGPFYLGMDDMSPQEVIENVIAKPNYYGAPFRPHIDDDTIDDVKIMMERCWSEEPAERPELRSLKLDIRKMNKENESGNILDNLLHRMEQYANNLESLVDERTRDYLDEKKKCEELLYQLLPKSVAAQLIMGRPVIAETFDMVTIYFSDIVGFTRISAESTPMQVVDFLNDLYTCFDSIVENFDVYKVETIGDAYMVVSGLPVKNGIEHAKEISRMALALLNAVQKFKIRHRPNEALKLRIGLHSGPCVAGVIGLKMPRYCLFGDTVNTASRMESNGEALKIHMSQSTKDLLDNFDGFEVAERGVMEIKGKGPMKTYWLLGEKYPFTPRLDKMMDDYPNFTASLINSNNYKYLNGGIHNSNNNINIVNNNLFRNVPTSISHTFLKGIGSNNQLKKKGIADDLSHVTQPLLVSK